MGYTRYDSIEAYMMAIDQAINDTMQTDITAKAQEAMQQSMDEHVYS